MVSRVKMILKQQLNMSRQVDIVRASRLHTGPDVRGCRPVLVTFLDFSDRQEVLHTSKVNRGTVDITEDLSQKTREGRHQLRKFLREVKRYSPEKKAWLEYDRLLIDGKMFVYSKEEGRVTECKGKDKLARTPSLDNLIRSEQPTPTPQLALSYTRKESIHEDQDKNMDSDMENKTQDDMQNGLMERLQHLEQIINQQNSMLQDQCIVIEEQRRRLDEIEDRI